MKKLNSKQIRKAAHKGIKKAWLSRNNAKSFDPGYVANNFRYLRRSRINLAKCWAADLPDNEDVYKRCKQLVLGI